MSVCYPKSVKFIEAVNKQCGFSKSWNSAYHDHGCYYDAGCCSKHDYMFEIETSDSWTAADTNQMKALIRKVCGGPVYGKQVKNSYGYHWLELHFDCSAKVLEQLEGDNPEFKLWKFEQVKKRNLPEGMSEPVFTAEELDIISKAHPVSYYAALPEAQKVAYREAASKYHDYQASLALRPVYEPINYDRTDEARIRNLDQMHPIDQRAKAVSMANKIKDLAKLERRYSASYQICGPNAPATEVFRSQLYFRQSELKRI